MLDSDLKNLYQNLHDWDERTLNEFVEHSLSQGAILNKHPLGFFHVRLKAIYPLSVRLHIWSSEDRYTQHPNWPIHSHSFSFVSRILYGEVTNSVFVVEAASHGLGGASRLYDVSYDEHYSLLTPTEKLVKVTLDSSAVLKGGDSYRLEAGIFHDTSVPNGIEAATLVVAKEYGRHISVVGSSNNDSTLRYQRDTLDKEESSIQLRKFYLARR